MPRRDATLSDIVGHTFTEIAGMEKGSEEILFQRKDGIVLRMYHEQDCCENVEVEDVVGDVADLLNTPILYYNDDVVCGVADGYESSTATFYNFRTLKGSVTLRWLGTSNGYYSERVAFDVLEQEEWEN